MITTNFDTLLESALEAAGVHPVVVTTPSQILGLPPLRDIACLLVKVHGDYRDQRIKNTPAELARYAPALRALLKTVLEDHGLLICGWSGEWDTALRQAIEGARLRAALFWAALGPPQGAAARLLDLKRGRHLTISGADEFFEELADRVLALDRYSQAHPVSLEALLARVKLYLPEPRYRIQLADLLRNESQAAFSALRDANLFDDRAPLSDESLFFSRLDAMDAATERICCVFAVTSAWGGAEEARSVARCLTPFLTPRAGVGGGTSYDIPRELCHYPALRILYAVGLAAVVSGNFAALAALSKLPCPDLYGSDPLPLFLRLSPHLVLHRGFLGKRFRVIAPTSSWFAHSMPRIFAAAVGASHEFDPALDYFEYLAALLAAAQATENDWYLPLGRFALQQRAALTKLARDLATEQAAWPPLVAGLFGCEEAGTTSHLTYGNQAEVDAGTKDCVTGDVCVKLIVHCAAIPSISAIPPRYRPANPVPDVLIRIKSPDAVVFPAGPIGGVILTTGGGSGSFYGGSTEPTGAHYLVYASRTVDNFNLAGYQTFEARWFEALPTGVNRTGSGIFAGAEGYGGEKMMCGMKEVAEWLSLNYTPLDANSKHQRLCATGNSGGGMQIAYALSAYNAGRYIKTALFSGGPSWTSVHALCFETPYQNGRLPNGAVDPLTPQSLTGGSHDSYGREQMEIALDLPVNPNGNPNYGSSYCSVGESPNMIADLGQAEYDFLISSSLEQYGINSATRNFTLAAVLKIFVSGELDFTGAKVQGDHYKSAILNNGGTVLEDHVLDAGMANLDYLTHEIQNTDSGALKIEQNLTTGTRCTYSPVL